MSSDIYLKIKNNSAQPQNIVLFDVVGVNAGQNAIGQNTKYQWDITDILQNAILYNQTALVLLAADINTGIYQALTYVNPDGVFNNVAQVVTGLNSFNIGVFSNNGNIVTGYCSSFILSSLNLCILTTAVAAPEATTDVNGTLIYDPGYTDGLIGNFTRISLLNAFWINNPANLINGPFNRAAITSPLAPVTVKTMSLIAQLQTTVAKTVYVGISFTGSVNNGGGSLYLNNNLVWGVNNSSEENAVASNVNTILGTAFTTNTIMDTLFHIVPITLQPGNNLIQAEFNRSIAMEIYDNTAAEIAAATSYAGLSLLYSSIDNVGQQLF